MSFDVALSGLNAAQADLNVISHNIANASTTGFKSSRAEFADVYAVTQTGLSRNAIGRGVDLKSVRQEFTQGGITFTQNNLDLAVSGQGFFRVSDAGATAYTRSGHFGVDRDGYIVNSSNQRLQGYQATDGVLSGAIGDLNVDFSDFPPKASTSVTIGANLDATSTAPTVAFDINDSTSYNDSTSTTVYDSLGTSHVMTTYYRKTGSNAWQAHVYLDNTSVTGATPITMTFDNAGEPTGGGVTTLPAAAVAGGAAPLTLTLDQNAVTQFGSVFGVNKLSQDGYPTGRLSDLDVDQHGNISARFTNGLSSVLGQVVLAN
ncbi:MAG: flagellar hook protein FlgE, partial [Gammaproteobacteria bacterium]|nr:flagellar hook protein FlgE [Gammaproteobacteria bacterium]